MVRIQESLGKYGTQKEALDNKKNIVINKIKETKNIQLKTSEVQVSGDVVTILSNSVVRSEIIKDQNEVLSSIRKEGFEIKKIR